jgi:DNA-binding transcriptional regulator/RsmH inhibitor MraZ
VALHAAGFPHGKRVRSAGRRTIFAGADLQSPDKSGRVLVKPDLRDFAKLETGTEIAVLGLFDHIELWEKDRHLQEKASGDESYIDQEEGE